MKDQVIADKLVKIGVLDRHDQDVDETVDVPMCVNCGGNLGYQAFDQDGSLYCCPSCYDEANSPADSSPTPQLTHMGTLMTEERRFEVIIREHSIERDGSKVKSRRYDIYKRVFDIARREQVIESVEAALNEQTPF